MDPHHSRQDFPGVDVYWGGGGSSNKLVDLLVACYRKPVCTFQGTWRLDVLYIVIYQYLAISCLLENIAKTNRGW